MADTANSVIKSKFIARYGPMRAGFGVKQTTTVPSEDNRFWTDIDGTQRPLSLDNVKNVTTAALVLKNADNGTFVVIASSSASRSVTLPKPGVGLKFTVYIKTPSTSDGGHAVKTSSSSASQKVYAKGISEAVGKGLVSTDATSAKGDQAHFVSDGVDWFAVTTGTWAVEA